MEQISKYSCPFLSENQVLFLRCHEIKTFRDFIKSNKLFVMVAVEFSDNEYETTLDHIKQRTRAVGPLFLTGIEKLDQILEGGLDGGEILEFYGKSGTGKTQLCLAIASQFCHFRTDDKRAVVYFDFKNDFKASRFLSFCKGYKEDLTNIQIIRPSNFPELLAEVEELYIAVCEVKSRFYETLKLIVFDSVPMFIYPTITEDYNSWRINEQQFINKLAKLTEIGCIIIFVNHATTRRNDKDSNPILANFQKYIPALGKNWVDQPNFRFYVSRKWYNPLVCNAVLEKSTRTDVNVAFDFSITKDEIKCLY